MAMSRSRRKVCSSGAASLKQAFKLLSVIAPGLYMLDWDADRLSHNVELREALCIELRNVDSRDAQR